MKLVVREAQSTALHAALDAWPDLGSSRLARVEVPRAVGVHGAAARKEARSWLDTLLLVPLDDAVLDAAAGIQPAAVRSLDAIHLASAASLEGDLGALITYDRRMIDAAAAAGLPIVSPI